MTGSGFEWGIDSRWVYIDDLSQHSFRATSAYPIIRIDYGDNNIVMAHIYMEDCSFDRSHHLNRILTTYKDGANG